MPTIISRPHILKDTTYKTIVPEGTYLSKIVDGLDVTTLYIELNGTPVKQGDIPFIKLQKDDILVITNVPQAAAIPTIIVTLAQIGAYLGASALHWTAFATFLTVTAVTIGTTLLVNALIPAQTLDDGDKTPTLVKPNITGSQNNYALWKPIPRLYGTYKYYPPLAARYFTEIAGGDQYLRMLLCLGYGPLEIGGQIVSRTNKLTHESGITSGAIKIGDTDVLSYQDVEYEIGTIDKITLFTSNIVEDNLNIPLTCQSTNGEDGWYSDDISASRSTDVNATEISLDIVFPQGLYTMGKNGRINYGNESAAVEFTITITDATTNTTIITETFDVTGARKETYRINKRYIMPYEGQFNVTVERVGTRIYDRDVVVTDAIWTVLRTIKNESPVIDNGKEIIYMALRIKATDQLNGVINQLNVTATSVLPVYDGTTWANQPTNNPAWCYYNQLTGEHVKNPIPETDILLSDFVEWASFCNGLGLTFNYMFDSEQTQFDRLKNIATTGRGSFAYKDGYYTVIWDADTSGQPPVQIISPRNSRNFSATKLFHNLPHALRVRYIDKNNDYAEDEIIVYRDGYDSTNATRFEKFDTLGVTDQQQAWKEGKYFFRQAILRPEKFEVEMDYENLVFTRGDVVLLSYDIIEVGLKWGRIKDLVTDSAGDITVITLDELCPMETGKSYGIQIRKQDGSVLSTTVVNNGDGEFTELYLDTPITGANIGDLVLFGEYGEEAIRCKVLSIDYNYDLSAKITLVPEAPDINDVGTAPVYDPHITLPLEFTKITPPTPSLEAFSGTNTLILSQDGTYQPSVVVTWVIPSTSRVPLASIDIRWKSTDDSEDNWHYITHDYSNTSLRIQGVEEDMTIQIQGRIKSVYGMYSDWSTEITHTVAGNSLIPEDVSNFTATWNPEQQIILFTWDEVSDINLDHFEIREGADWDTGTPVLQNISDFRATLFIDTVNDTTKIYWIKGVSKTGVESTNAVSTSVLVNFPNPSAATAITTTSLNYAIKVNVTYTKETYFDKLEIWASDTNDRNNASLVASIEDDEFILDGLDLVDTRYFWVRQRNIFGRYSDWYPLDEYSGVVGTTDSSPDKLLPLLTGAITEDQLYQDLNDKINWLDTDTFVLESDILESGIVGGIDRLTLDNGNNIIQLQLDMDDVQDELAQHLSQIQSLQSDISALTTSDWDSTVTYTLGRIVRYNDETWRCIQENTGIAPDDPENTDASGDYVYWEPTDALSTIVADIDQRVDTLENEITTKVSQTDFDGLSNTVSTHDTLIQQNSDAIELKADKTEVSALSSLLIQDFDDSLTYSKWDLVKYEGSAYQAIQDINFTPAPLPTDTTYWQLIDEISDVISHNSSNIEINTTDIQLHSTSIVGDIALADDIVEDDVVVFDIDDIENLDNRVSESYLKASKAEIKIDSLNNTISEQLSGIENSIEDHETRLSNTEHTISILQDVDDNLISQIQQKVSLVVYERDVDNDLKPRMATAEQDITTLYTQDDTLQAQINDRVTITTYDADVTNDLKPRMSSAESNISVLQTDMGDVKAEWTVKLNADGNIAGVGLITSTDAPSEFVVLTDIFKIVNPNDSADVKIPFVVGTINGVSTVGISGDLIVDGSIVGDKIAASTIQADKLDVSNLSSISANLGTINTGNVTLGSYGYVRGGKTSYSDDTNYGFWIGQDSDDKYKVKIGGGNDYIKWDGDALTVSGNIYLPAPIYRSAKKNNISVLAGENKELFSSVNLNENKNIWLYIEAEYSYELRHDIYYMVEYYVDTTLYQTSWINVEAIEGDNGILFVCKFILDPIPLSDTVIYPHKIYIKNDGTTDVTLYSVEIYKDNIFNLTR